MFTSKILQHLKDKGGRSVCFGLLVVLAITSIYFVIHNPNFHIDLYDEPLYLGRALTLYYFDKEWSPPYSFFYYLQYFFIDDPLYLYYFNHYLLSAILFPIAIYVLALKIFKKVFVASILSLTLFFTSVNLEYYPYVHIFNFTIHALLFLFLFNFRSLVPRLLFFLLLGMGIHIRMENIVTLSLITTFSSFLVFRENTKKGWHFFILAIVLSGAGFFSLKWDNGRPFSPGESRMIHALQDHYVWTHPEMKNVDAFKEKFPKGPSFKDFVINYPGPLLEHVFDNIKRMPERLLRSLHLSNVSQMFIILILLGLGFLLPTKIIFQPLIWVFLLSFSLQTLILSLILQPQPVYLLSLVVTFSFLIILLVHKLFQGLRSRVLPTALRIVLPATILIMFDTEIRFREGEKDLQNNTLQAMRQVDFHDYEVILFDNHMPIYINARFTTTVHTIDQFEITKNKDFDMMKWIKEKGITSYCFSEHYYQGATHLSSFDPKEIRSNPEKFGFKVIYDKPGLLKCFRAPKSDP